MSEAADCGLGEVARADNVGIVRPGEMEGDGNDDSLAQVVGDGNSGRPEVVTVAGDGVR